MKLLIRLKSKIKHTHTDLFRLTSNPKHSLANVRRRSSDDVFARFRNELNTAGLIVGRHLQVLSHKRVNPTIVVSLEDPKLKEVLLTLESVSSIETLEEDA